MSTTKAKTPETLEVDRGFQAIICGYAVTSVIGWLTEYLTPIVGETSFPLPVISLLFTRKCLPKGLNGQK